MISPFSCKSTFQIIHELAGANGTVRILGILEQLPQRLQHMLKYLTLFASAAPEKLSVREQ